MEKILQLLTLTIVGSFPVVTVCAKGIPTTESALIQHPPIYFDSISSPANISATKVTISSPNLYGKTQHLTYDTQYIMLPSIPQEEFQGYLAGGTLTVNVKVLGVPSVGDLDFQYTFMGMPKMGTMREVVTSKVGNYTIEIFLMRTDIEVELGTETKVINGYILFVDNLKQGTPTTSQSISSFGRL